MSCGEGTKSRCELFDPVQVSRYRWDQSYTTEQYARLLRTFSDTLAMEATAREGLIRDLCRLIDTRFGGRIVRPLVVTSPNGAAVPTRTRRER